MITSHEVMIGNPGGPPIQYVCDDGGSTWYSVPDTCSALGHKRGYASTLAAKLPAHLRTTFNVEAADGARRDVLFVQFNGWCELIMRSQGTNAERVRSWLRLMWAPMIQDTNRL